MTSTELRNQVKEYVDTADVRLLMLLKALAETYHDNDQEFSLSEEQYQMLDKRREAHLKEKSKSLTWEEVKKNARKANF